MKHFLTLEKGGYRFVCNIPTESRERLEFAVEVWRGQERVRDFAVPMSRRTPDGADVSDTLTLQYEIDRYLERSTAAAGPDVHPGARRAPVRLAWLRERFRLTRKRAGTAPPAEPLSERLQRYGTIEFVGRGSLADVHHGVDDKGKHVAIKVVRAPQGGPAAEIALKREAAVLQEMLDPNIVTPHDIFLHDGSLHIVMDYVEDPPLRYALDEGAPREELVPLLARAARSVHRAHQNGILHRDLTARNVFVGTDVALVSDFGLARVLDASLRPKGAPPFGTPAYMAPEQIDRRRAAAAAATDVWALGVLLYEILCRRLPFFDTELPGLYARILLDPPHPPRAFDATVPPALEAICLRALEKDAGERYASAEAFAVDLERAAAGQSIPRRRLQRWWRRTFGRP